MGLGMSLIVSLAFIAWAHKLNWTKADRRVADEPVFVWAHARFFMNALLPLPCVAVVAAGPVFSALRTAAVGFVVLAVFVYLAFLGRGK